MGKLSDFENKNDKKQDVSEKDLRQKYDEYKDMNNQELSNELMKEVDRQKLAGTFDYEKLEGIVDGLRGSLPEENYRNIKRILEGLR